MAELGLGVLVQPPREGMPELHRTRGRGLPLTCLAIVDIRLPKALLERVGVEKVERQAVNWQILHTQPATQISETRGERELRARTPQGLKKMAWSPPPPQASHRPSIVLKVLPGLFPGTLLLITLPLQVPWREQLQVPVIGSPDSSVAVQEALSLGGVQEDF